MLRFILFAVLAYILYQIAMGIDWDRTSHDATNTVERKTEDAVQDVENSSVGRGVQEGADAVRDLFR